MNLHEIEGGVCAAKGFSAAGIHCGIRKNKEKADLALIYAQTRCTAAGVYTQNKVKGAPNVLTKQNLADGHAQAVIVNSGIANTCNADGMEKAQAMCDLTAQTLSIPASDVVVASTGVIGEPLLIEPIAGGLPKLAASLSPSGHADAATAILTTDTHKKEYAVCFSAGGVECRIGGMCKGSGMIHPNMATMLCFLTTDAAVSAPMLQRALKDVVDDTFNMVSVDGDTSTNDMVTLLASGLAGNPEISQTGDDYNAFCEALYAVLRVLSMEIAKDGEGATRLVECVVSGVKDKATARTVAKSVITSSLLKAAVFGADANWGRILCAIGYAPGDFSIEHVSVALSDRIRQILVCKDGMGVPFSEEEAKSLLSGDEIQILIDINEGAAQATAWGCDLTYDYVRINGDYRS